MPNKDTKSDFYLDNWFKKHPEQIMGETLTRKNKYGKLETYVKKRKETTPKKTQLPLDESKKTQSQNSISKNVLNDKTTKNSPYENNYTISKEDYQLFSDTLVDGTLPKDKYSPNEKINQFKGKLYNDFNYLQGDIYEKLDVLKLESLSEAQKEIQRKKLESVLPKPKEVNEINFVPTSEFIRELSFGKETKKTWNRLRVDYVEETVHDTLDKRFIEYVNKLSSSERNNMPVWDIISFIQGKRVKERTYGSEQEKAAAKIEYITKLKNTTDSLFNQYVQTHLSKDDKKILQDKWNRTFNAIHNPDYNNVPLMVKNLSATFYDKPLKLLPVQKEGINFLTNKGVGLLGFEVGVGKTLTGIVATVQNMQMGRCKRPLILAPKQVKANWIREINQLFPDVKVVDVDNLSKFKGKIEDGTISIGTYEALGNIWYDEKIDEDSQGKTYRTGYIQDLIDKLYNVSTDFNRDSTNKAREQQFEDIEKIVGIAEKNNKKLYKIDDLGFDHLTVDEAHNFRNLFRQAKAYGRDNNAYQKVGSGGNPSSRAARLFFLTQHILDKNDNRNVFFLTATPFNNSPLEVFNMLSYIGKDMLDKMGLYNVYQFMDTYADITSDWVVKNNNDVDYTQVAKGFKNAGSLREVIKSLMLIRSADVAGVKRPNKHVDRVVLEPSDKQLELIDRFESEAMHGKKNDGAILKCINQSRQVTLSPDIATKNYSVSAEDFINNSPKLKYIANAISLMQKKDPSTSQLLYMPLGVEFLPKLKEYFVNNNIFKPDEIEIISSETNDDKIPKITDSFNDPDGTVKLIIGTQRIKEGMNLNKNSSVLYIPFIDWNPTDFLQIIGRVWRQGNRYKNIKVVVPLLKNSSDPFMFQKLDEKTSRINNIMDESKEYIETGELNTAEEKLNMITIPEKKVQMFEQLQNKNIERAYTKLKGRLETAEHYKEILNETTHTISNLKERVEYAKEKLKYTSKEDTKNYEYISDNLKATEKALKKAQNKLEAINNTITRLEIDFEGKDSKESIQNEMEKLDKKKDELGEIVKKQLEKYRVEYYKEQQNKIPLEAHLKNFEKSLDKFYGKNEEVFDSLPEYTETFKKTAESDFNVPKIKLKTESQISSKERQKAKLTKLKEIENAKPQKKYVQEMIRGWAVEIDKNRYTANRDINFFINKTKVIAKDLKTKDKLIREILPFLRERTEIPEALDRTDLKELWNRLTKNDKEKLTKLADSISEKFDKYWQEYQGLNADEAVDVSKSAIENHISHLWDVDNKQKSLLTNYFATKSRFAKKRTIETLFDGINGIEAENGELIQFKPKTLDYAEILKIQSDSLIKAVADKRLANNVKNLKNSDGLNLVLPSHKAPSDWIEIDHPAINKTIAKPLNSTFGEVVSPKLQNILSEMGIAIGRRLNKYKAGGELNALGKYLHSKQPPEIRLQRWFSNKTLAHEIGHALDKALNLKKESFVTRYKDEINAINKDRIENFTKLKKKSYATKDSELTAEFFAYFFNDFDKTYKIAPRATSHIIDLISNNKTFQKLLPNNFDWNNAKHVLEESKIELIKTKVRVHPDIADTIKIVFEKQGDPTLVGKVYDNINAVLKQFNLGFSGFHAVALTESALANLGISGTLKILNPVKIFRSLMKNDWDIYNLDSLARQAIADGLQIGATLDVHRRMTEKLIEDTGTWAEKNIPILGKPVATGAKILSYAQKLNNKILWDYLHNNYKLATYQALIQAESAKGKLSQSQRRAIAQWVNDSYGGQVWENLGIKPSGRKWEQRILLSPDWLRSTTRQAFTAISNEKLSKTLQNKSKDSAFWEKAKILGERWGISDLTDNVKASGTSGKIARRFWRNAFIQYCVYANAINAIFRERDREENPELYPKNMSPTDYSILGNSMKHQSYIFIGRNSDGTERYMRLGKQFREVPELATNFTEKIGGKASPTLQLLSQTFTGKSLSGFENRDITENKGIKKTAAIAKMWAKAPLPYSMSSLFNPNKDISVADFFAGTSKGMTFYKGQEYYQEAIKKGDKKEIQKISKDLVRNKVNPSDVFKFAIKELKKEARREARKM